MQMCFVKTATVPMRL